MKMEAKFTRDKNFIVSVTTAKSCADQALSDLIYLDSKMRACLEWLVFISIAEWLS